MKTIQRSLQPSAYRVCELELVNYDDIMQTFRIRETRENIFHMDFAVLLNGVWHEGRCYGVPEDDEGCYLMTTGDSRRIRLRAGMSIRLPYYTLSRVQIFQLAKAYLQELGFQARGKGQLLQPLQQLHSPDVANVRFSVAPPRSFVTVSVRLESTGDIALLADSEDFSPPSMKDWKEW